MEAKELMIGDWVMQAQFTDLTNPQKGHGWKYVKVTTIPFDEYNFIEPIPLTHEILEKNGFYDVEPDGYPTITKITSYKDGTFCWCNHYGDASIELKYVHELQHLLKLLKIDKEIEL